MTFAPHYCSRRPVRWAVAGALAVAVMSAIAPLSQKAYAATGWQKLTESELTVIWWQWLYSIPASTDPAINKSPVIDDTGANAYNGQPYSDLLFLAGTYVYTGAPPPSGNVLGTATRSISMKPGTALFFPLINGEADNTCARPNLGGNCFGAQKFPNNLGVPQLQAEAAAAIDPVFGLYATLTPADQNFNQTGNPVNVGYTRLQSPHPFPYKLPATDNLLQFQGLNVSGTVAPAVADGYYSFLPLGTLDQGNYLLQFGGTVPISCPSTISGPCYFIENITYYITVTP